MSEEVCEMADLGLRMDRSDNILKVSDKSRTAYDPTDEVTMTIDTTFLSEIEVSELLEIAKEAFKGVEEKSHQQVNLILNDSSRDSAEFIKAILNLDKTYFGIVKIVLAVSGVIAVKNLGLSSALELLDAKVNDPRSLVSLYLDIETDDLAELSLFLLPGMVHRDRFFDRQQVTLEEIETVYQIDDIVQIISFAMQKDSSITLGEYLSSDRDQLETPAYTISGFAIRAIAKLAKSFKREVGLLTSDQLRELLSLVDLCELDSYSIEDLLLRLRLPRITWPYRLSACQYCTVPFFTLAEMSKLGTESTSLNLAIDKQIFAVHLHNTLDFLHVDLAVRKGVSRYVEFCSFISAFRESISDLAYSSLTSFDFKKDFDKYLIELTGEIFKSKNDDIPIAWIAAMSEHQPPEYFSS